MYDTIEPRLITLPSYSSPELFVGQSRLDLPPLDHNIPKASRRPPPLELNATISRDLFSLPSAHQNALLGRDLIDGLTGRALGGKELSNTSSAVDAVVGDTPPQSLRKIMDDVPEASTQPQPSKRRQGVDSSKDEFVQLPQPPKKLKTTQQVVPPIIIGLFEPPPNAALFPPITSSSFHDSHGRNSLNIAPPSNPQPSAPLDLQSGSYETSDALVKSGQKLAIMTRRKWTEEETTQLLLGVKAHGVGQWTKILHDLDFKFNDRKAVDLKDRFRTCCPNELRREINRTSTACLEIEDGIPSRMMIPKSSSAADNIFIDSDGSSTEGKTPPSQSSGLPKRRVDRMKLEDLAELGIKEPFKKSSRRERRPFSDEEDRDILRGFQKYGPAWTQILRDPKFDFKDRRPRDLRDRLRNKYPGKFLLEEACQSIAAEAPTLGNSMASPSSSSQTAELSSASSEPQTALIEAPQLSPGSVVPFKDSFLELLDPQPLSDATDELSFDWGDSMGDGITSFPTGLGDGITSFPGGLDEGITSFPSGLDEDITSFPSGLGEDITSFPSGMGEMDVSRILLEDNWCSR